MPHLHHRTFHTDKIGLSPEKKRFASPPASGIAVPRHSFTLLELCTVCAILGILVSLLLPAIARSRMEMQSTQCRSNLRQLGQAFAMYAADFKQKLPPRLENDDPYADGGRNWAAYLLPYYQNTNILDCPTSPDDAPAPTPQELHLYDGNYGWNFSATQGNFGSYLNRMAIPSRGYLLFDSGDPCVMDGGANWTNLMEELDLDFDSGLEGTNRHGNQTQICFADLHCAARDLEKFLAFPNERNTAPWYINWQKKIQPLGEIPFPIR